MGELPTQTFPKIISREKKHRTTCIKKNSPKLPLVFLKHERNMVHVFYFLNRKPVLCLY